MSRRRAARRTVMLEAVELHDETVADQEVDGVPVDPHLLTDADAEAAESRRGRSISSPESRQRGAGIGDFAGTAGSASPLERAHRRATTPRRNGGLPHRRAPVRGSTHIARRWRSTLSRWSSTCVLSHWRRPDATNGATMPSRGTARRRRLHSDVRATSCVGTHRPCRDAALTQLSTSTGRRRADSADRRPRGRSARSVGRASGRPVCDGIRHRPGREKPAARASAECAISPRRAIHSIRNVALATPRSAALARSARMTRVSALWTGVSRVPRWGGAVRRCVEIGNRR